MAARPSVSVIIPSYNGEEYLQQCLDSVFAQTLRNVQVICVNDGSTDGTAQILAENQRLHPNMVTITQENGGLSSARNAGIARAEGEYIDFLDCDDALQADALESLYTRAKQDSLDMLLYDGETIYATPELREALPGYERLYRTKIRIKENVLTGEQLFVRLVEGASYRASACMYLLRRAFLEECGYTFVPGIYYEDNVFTLQCLLNAKRAGLDPTPYYKRTMRDGSIVTVHKNYRHARSYYLCQHAIQTFLLNGAYAQETVECARQQISSLMNHAVRVYAELTDQEKVDAIAQFPDAALIGGMLQGSTPRPSSANKTATPTMQCTKPKWMSHSAMEEMTTQPYDKEHPLVSVILPVYNAETFLQETIDDLKHQTLTNFEMIFVDDGSTDESCNILERNAEKDRRISILHQKKQYAGVARNNGMAKAKGEYLVFLDSDDRFSPNLLAYSCACAEAQQADIVLYHADLLQMPQGQYMHAPYLCPCDRLPQQVFSGEEGKEHIFDVLNPWTKLYKRDFVKSLGIQYQPLFSSNDLYFSMVAMASAKRIAPLPEILVHYRVGQTNNIQSKKSKAPLDTYHAFKAVREELEKRGLFEIYRKPFAVKAAESMLRSLDTMTTLDGYKALYSALHNGGFSYFELDCVTNDDMRHISGGTAKLKHCREIEKMDFEPYLLQVLTNPGQYRSVPVKTKDAGVQLQELDRLQEEVRALRGSYAYRIGSKLTWPFHVIKIMLKRT